MKEFNAVAAYTIEIYSFVLRLPYGLLIVPFLLFILAFLFNYHSKRSCSLEYFSLLLLSFSMLLMFYAMVMKNEVLYMSGPMFVGSAGILRADTFFAQTIYVLFFIYLPGSYHILPIFFADKAYSLVLKLKKRSKNNIQNKLPESF